MERSEKLHDGDHGSDSKGVESRDENEDFYPAPRDDQKDHNFDGTKTQSSIRTAGSKQLSNVAYTEMTEKVAVKSTRKKVVWLCYIFRYYINIKCNA